MMTRKILLAGAAALALVACGKKDDSGAPAAAASGDAANLSATSPIDKKFALKDGEEINIDEFFAILAVDNPPTYDSAAFDKSLGATVVTNLRFGGGEGDDPVVVERAEFYGVDEEAMSRVRQAKDAGPDAPYEQIFEKVRLFNLSTNRTGDAESDGQADVSIGGIEFDKFALRQGGEEGNPDGDDAANFFNAVSFGGIYFKDIDVNVASDEDQNVALSAPDFRIVGMGGGKINAILASDVSYNFEQGDEVRAAMREAMGPQGAVLLDGPLGGMIAPDSQRATIGSFEWRGIDFSGALAYGVKGEDAPATERNLIDLGGMKIADMVSFIEDREVAKVDEISVPKMKFAWLIPSDFRMDMKGAVTDYTAYVPDAENPAHAVLKEHGLDKVKGDGFAEWKWNPDKGDGRFAYEAKSPGVLDLTMDLEMVGATLKEIAAESDDSENTFAKNAELKSFSLKLDDKKTLDAIFDIAALQMGGTGADLRQSAPALIRLSGAQFAQLNPRISDYIDAVADFIAKGGSLEIKAAPEEPVGAADLETMGAAPQALPDVLDLTITHEE